MKLLLDTNAFLYWTMGAKKLSARAQKAIANPRNGIYLSAVSAWEIAIKHSLGKLDLPEPPKKFVLSRLAIHAIVGLPFEHADALGVAELPPHHDDPFDRALIAQAIERDLTVVTSNERFEEYGIDIEW